MINLDEVSFEFTRGRGPGGQHKNKTDSCVVATHIPTGVSVRVDGRSQHKNKAEALKELERRLGKLKTDATQKRKKERRDEVIKDCPTIRTYNFVRQVVVDHRSGKKAPLKEVLEKGRIGLLYED